MSDHLREITIEEKIEHTKNRIAKLELDLDRFKQIGDLLYLIYGKGNMDRLEDHYKKAVKRCEKELLESKNTLDKLTDK